jgi:hypothetical protein
MKKYFFYFTKHDVCVFKQFSKYIHSMFIIMYVSYGIDPSNLEMFQFILTFCIQCSILLFYLNLCYLIH